MPGDDGATYVSGNPVSFSHVHGGERIDLVTDTVGVEASGDGLAELTEHRCPDCGEAFVTSKFIQDGDAVAGSPAWDAPPRALASLSLGC